MRGQAAAAQFAVSALLWRGHICGFQRWALETSKLTLKSKAMLETMSPLSGAIYQKPAGREMMKLGGYSPDSGRGNCVRDSSRLRRQPPYGYRRSPQAP